MKQKKVISPDEYKDKQLYTVGKRCPVSAARELPGADRLWDLLDRNISLSVWEKRR
jgi:hypothetical protein